MCVLVHTKEAVTPSDFSPNWNDYKMQMLVTKSVTKLVTKSAACVVDILLKISDSVFILTYF